MLVDFFVVIEVVSVSGTWQNKQLHDDTPPSSLCDPKKVQRVGFAELVKNLVPLPASSTKRGKGVMLETPGLN
jgi:hypothetical protein